MNQPDKHLAHLDENQPQIVLRSLLVAGSALLPVPVIDDALSAGIKRGLLRRIAQRRQVDIDEAALDLLCSEDPQHDAVSLSLTAALGGVLSFLRPRRLGRRLLFGLGVLRQLGEAQRVFMQATLFDHYCARHHLGLGIDLPAAHRLRATFNEVGRATQRQILSGALDGALELSGQAARAVPARVRGLLSGLRGKGAAPSSEAPPARTPLVPALLHTVRDGTRRLRRDMALHRYTGLLVDAFDRRWAGHTRERGGG